MASGALQRGERLRHSKVTFVPVKRGENGLPKRRLWSLCRRRRYLPLRNFDTGRIEQRHRRRRGCSDERFKLGYHSLKLRNPETKPFGLMGGGRKFLASLGKSCLIGIH